MNNLLHDSATVLVFYIKYSDPFIYIYSYNKTKYNILERLQLKQYVWLGDRLSVNQKEEAVGIMGINLPTPNIIY